MPHTLECDCPACEQRESGYTLFLAFVLCGLYLFGFYLVLRSGMFAWASF